MISKRIPSRKDGKSSASDLLRYGAGLKLDRTTGVYIDKALRIRLSGFGLVDDGIYIGQPIDVISGLIELAALEMQSNCDLNTRVGPDKKIAHFVFSFGQTEPTEAALRDVEDSTRVALKLEGNHLATFLHSDNGHFHQHMIFSRVSKQAPHNGNSLWRDRILRDKVCRAAELKFNDLKRDRGLHRIGVNDEIVEIPIAERRENRENKQGISGSAKNIETIRAEKSFQTYVTEIRIGDHLKHATSWQDLHSIAAAYSCEIKPRGAGYVISSLGESGGQMQLSKLGVKNLSRTFGPFELATAISSIEVKGEYKPAPTKAVGSLYADWKIARASNQELKATSLSEFRKIISLSRLEVRERQKRELAGVRASVTGSDRRSAISIEKMKHSAELTQLAAETRIARSNLYKTLAQTAPDTNFRNYLQQQAQSGSDAALELVRQFGIGESTSVSIQIEFIKLKIVGAISGAADKPISRANIEHHVEHNGTIVFDLGRGRIITDSAIAKKIQLNAASANDVEAIETSLRFAASRFGKSLTLFGSPEFQRLAVETAVRNRLNIEFTDPVLETYRKSFENVVIHKEGRNVEHARTNQVRKIPSTNRGDRLHSLSECALVSDPQDVEVLLPADVSHHVGKPLTEEHTHSELRRNAIDGSNVTGASPTDSKCSFDDNHALGKKELLILPDNKVSEIAKPGYQQAPGRGRQAISNKPRKGR